MPYVETWEAKKGCANTWIEAVERQKQAYEAWAAFLYESETEAIP
jgi:hypothetical protein